MSKIQKISDLQPTLAFSEFYFYSSYQESFLGSELGELYSLIPFDTLAQSMNLRTSTLGRTSYFEPQGKIALMLLKSYTGFSDEVLLANLNSNIHYQLFCGIRINPLDPLTNFKIISEIRCQLGDLLKIDKGQQALADYWKPYMENQHLGVCMSDATCYESYIRYPTDVKLLWESTEWLHKHMCGIYKGLNLRKPRSKYDSLAKKYKNYSKSRRRKKVTTNNIKRSLLHMLNKIIILTENILKHNKNHVELPKRFHKRLSVIKKVYVQQQARFDGQEVKNAIVSIDKEYIRPIVRGKENKAVEFGAKVNTLQVDGINFIEHLSFRAFHEGIRLPQCIAKQQKLFRTKVSFVAADAIYATNANRMFCTKRKIITSFVPKGRPAEDEQQRKIIRSALSKERSTRLEGSFGTEKQHYNLQKIKARTKQTEILWIFFGIHTANAVRMIPKKRKALKLDSA